MHFFSIKSKFKIIITFKIQLSGIVKNSFKVNKESKSVILELIEKDDFNQMHIYQRLPKKVVRGDFNIENYISMCWQ